MSADPVTRNDASLERDGHTEIELCDPDALGELQALVASHFPSSPLAWHEQRAPQDEHIALVARITQAVAESPLLTRLLAASAAPLVTLLGPSLDIQAVPHVRLSRPSVESDFVDWHRDTFYGNTPWELNVWMPLFPLGVGAGLLVVPGTHVEPSINVRAVTETDAFRRTVTRGSTANRIGYVYAPKTDNTIAALDPSRARLVAPEIGRAVIFFGHMVHRAQNESSLTRISIDVRVRSPHTPTNTRPNYYRALFRSVVDTCATRFAGTT